MLPALLATHAVKATGYRFAMTSPMPAASEDDGPVAVFRLPRMAYGAVVLLVFCVIPFALTAGAGSLRHNTTSHATLSWRLVLLLIPALAALFIARTATFVDTAGIRTRAMFGQRRLPWSEIRGLSVWERSVYAVVADGALRLPCVRIVDLAVISRVSGGHIPDLPFPPLKSAPSRRRR